MSVVIMARAKKIRGNTASKLATLRDTASEGDVVSGGESASSEDTGCEVVVEEGTLAFAPFLRARIIKPAMPASGSITIPIKINIKIPIDISMPNTPHKRMFIHTIRLMPGKELKM